MSSPPVCATTAVPESLNRPLRLERGGLVLRRRVERCLPADPGAIQLHAEREAPDGQRRQDRAGALCDELDLGFAGAPGRAGRCGAAVGVGRVEAFIALERAKLWNATKRPSPVIVSPLAPSPGGRLAVREDGDALDGVGDAVVDEDVLVEVRVGARSQEVEARLTKVITWPSSEMAGWKERPSGKPPPKASLTSSVMPSWRSRRDIAAVEPSPTGVRRKFVAVLSKATKRPSAEITGRAECPFALPPPKASWTRTWSPSGGRRRRCRRSRRCRVPGRSGCWRRCR